MKRLLPLAALVALVGCGQSGVRTTSVVTTTAAQHKVSFDIFLLQTGTLVVVHRELRSSKPALATAVEQLAAGPTERERAAGLSTALPARLGFQATDDSGVEVNLTTAVSRPALAQLTYTLSRFDQSQTEVRINGKTYERSEFERFVPAIMIESPTFDQPVRSPLHVAGSANTFEATFVLELRTGGRLLGKKTVTAVSGSGVRGKFESGFRYSVSEETRGELRAYELSAKNGEPINEVSVPISLLP